MTGEPDEAPAVPDRTCDQCGEWIREDALLYELHITIRAEPKASLDDLPNDVRSMQEEWDALIARMEGMTEEEVDEATDQVFEEYRFRLCGPCRKELHRRLKRRNLLP